MSFKSGSSSSKAGPARPAAEEDTSGNPKPLATALLQELQNFRDKLKNEDETVEKESPFQNLEKATVLQECRVFHDASVVTQNPRKCCLLITKLLFLLVKGESFTSSEITEVFFGVTKLFQSKDVNLRRMMYLFIKEVAETCNPDDVIIVTSSLTKDMNTGEDLYRANAMRVLAKIIDAAMLGAIERYIKQAIVDRNAFVASSALMAGLQLFQTCPDVVRRWINEVQEAVNSSNDMVQYHALSLLYKIKQHDRLAVSKVVQQLSKGSLRSPMAACLLIRYTSSLVHEDSTNAKTSYQFLETCLRHKSDMVICEAAKAICKLPGVTATDLFPAITVLQLFLTSHKPPQRFAAMRILSEVAVSNPISVARCNDDIETLVNDNNRSISTLAITTLLKTGTESSIDRLMKQISSFMTEIGDEFKVVVVKAIRELCVKYPAKHRVMVGFLSTFLREEGGFEFKKSIVDSIVDLMTTIPETKETSLLHLCEFIEDCEFSELIIQILHLIGTTGPATASPARYIRFIFNRVILENASVRAAAVSTLGVFAIRVPELKPSILPLLLRSVSDDDDEVRDRAAILLATLSSTPVEEQKLCLDEQLPVSFAALERSLQAYMSHPLAGSETKPVTFSSLPVIDESYAPAAQAASRSGGGGKKKPAETTSAASAAAPAEADKTKADPAAVVYAVPELASLGRAFRSSKETPLTETEMEYVVACTKHVFDSNVVLQFNILNTIDDQLLKNVRVEVEVSDEELYRVVSVIAAPVAKYGERTNCFVSLARLQGPVPATVSCTLHFNVVQVDPSSGEIEGDEDGYEEEYPLEAVQIATSDYMMKTYPSDFRKQWEEMGTGGEVLEKFALQFKKLEDAIEAMLEFLGMAPVDGTRIIPYVPPVAGGQKRSHTVHLFGRMLGGELVMARAQLTSDDSAGSTHPNSVILKLAVRSSDKSISTRVADCIQ